MNTMENGSTIDTLVKNPTVVSLGYNSTANNTTTDGDPVPNPVVFAMGYSFMAFLSIITGVVGLLANGSVLFILVITKKKTNSSNFLIIFQFVVNVVACALLIVSYSMKLMLDVKGDTMKRWGLTICILFVGDGLAYMASDAAATNLGMIAFERYMKIVHAVRHRTYFRQWMYYPVVAFTIVSSIMFNIPISWTTIIDENGGCLAYQYWQSAASFQAYATTLTLWGYVGLLVELIYCYGCIIVKLKRRSSAIHDSTSNNGVNQEGSITKEQVNVIKTMILISLTYAVTTMFIRFGYISVSFGDIVLIGSDTAYYMCVSLYFMNAWLDPFIYAISNREVRRKIQAYVSPWKIPTFTGTIHNESQ